MNRLFSAVTVFILLVVQVVVGQTAVEKMKAATVNEWVVIDSVETGGKCSPVLVYDKQEKKVILSAGQKGGLYGGAKLHFDTEYFGLDKGEWINAYPPNTPYKVMKGVTDAPVYGGGRIPFMGKDTNGVMRIKSYGNSHYQSSRAWAQYALNSDEQKIYLNAVDTTAVYDLKEKTWSKLDVPEFNGDERWSWSWGALCYDGYNKELLAYGGSSGYPGGACGTWRLTNVAGSNKWVRVVSGSEELRKAHLIAVQLRKYSWSTFSLARNKYYSSETEPEKAVSLEKLSKNLVAKVTAVAQEFNGVNFSGNEKSRKTRALSELRNGLLLLDGITGKVTIEQLDKLRAVFELLKQAEYNLSPEPPSRGFSQMAYDEKSKKIILFGGTTQSSVFGDTWIYDVKTRSWEPRYPAANPSPRAGHAMLYLPKSKKVAIIGGFTVLDQIIRNGGYKGDTCDNWVHITPQIWTYNVAKNRWDLNYQFELPGKEGEEYVFHSNSGRTWHYQYDSTNITWKEVYKGTDKKEYAAVPLAELGKVSWSSLSSPLCVTVTENDELIAISTGGKGRKTYYMQLETAKKLDVVKDKVAVESGVMHYAPGPNNYYKNNIPNVVKMQDFYSSLPDNQWIKIPVENKTDINWRSWGSISYDVERNQLLWWGGGHVTWLGTDVNHFHFDSGVWSVSDDIGIPVAPDGGFLGMVSQSVTGQPHIPVHNYQAYAYDPTCGRMVYLDRAYDVASRSWIDGKIKGYKHIPYKTTVMYSALEGTPHGVFYLSDEGLNKYDADKNEWVAVVWDGPTFGRPWCDGTAALYDSKRDCIWFANKDVYQYNIKDGKVVKINVDNPPVRGGKEALGREAVYVPELDMIMVQAFFRKSDGVLVNLLWDPVTKKYYQAILPWMNGDNMAEIKRGFGWAGAVHYDPKHKTVIQGDGIRSPYVIKFNKKSLKMTEYVAKDDKK